MYRPGPETSSRCTGLHELRSCTTRSRAPRAPELARARAPCVYVRARISGAVRARISGARASPKRARASAERASPERARITGARISGSRVSGARFSGARLRSAHLRRLRSAHLRASPERASPHASPGPGARMCSSMLGARSVLTLRSRYRTPAHSEDTPFPSLSCWCVGLQKHPAVMLS